MRDIKKYGSLKVDRNGKGLTDLREMMHWNLNVRIKSTSKERSLGWMRNRRISKKQGAVSSQYPVKTI